MRFVKIGPNGLFGGHYKSPAEWAAAEPVKLATGHFVRTPAHLVLPNDKAVEVRIDKDGNLLLGFEDA